MTKFKEEYFWPVVGLLLAALFFMCAREYRRVKETRNEEIHYSTFNTGELKDPADYKPFLY